MNLPWWHPQKLAGRRENLMIRARVRRAIEDYFAEESILAVETPALQISPGMEPHLFAFSTVREDHGGKAFGEYHLHTSPEFAMKKLIAGGSGSIYQFARVFRNRERSHTHHPEFTMLEWYRVGDPLEAIAEDCKQILKRAASESKQRRFARKGLVCDPHGQWEEITVVEAFRKYADIDLEPSLRDGLNPDASVLAQAAQAQGIAVGKADSWDDIFFRIFLEKIETNLGLGAPTLLKEYPACMAALSRRSSRDPRFAERFEIYVCGLELANAFGELTDAKEQRRRFEADMALKEKIYGMRYPIDDDFLKAVGMLPDCAGIALGFDRLAMLAAGVEAIDDVLWAPMDEPRSH